MADANNVSLLMSIGALLAATAAGTSVLRFWSTYSDRITRADSKADSAQQEAAEAKNDVSNLRETITAMGREIDDVIERRAREQGDGLNAIRQHVTDLAFFVRDNFVRQPEFIAAMKKIEDGQARMETKLDEMRKEMRP